MFDKHRAGGHSCSNRPQNPKGRKIGVGEVRTEIAEKLLYYRKLKGITQRQLAESIGVKHNSISAWEKGTNAIDIEVLYRICCVLDITISDIYGRFGGSGSESLSYTERQIIEAYRHQPEMQLAVRRVLDLH